MEADMTQTHDNSPKLWDVWVRYHPKGIQNLTKKKPLPQGEAMALVENLKKGLVPKWVKLDHNRPFKDVWCEEVL